MSTAGSGPAAFTPSDSLEREHVSGVAGVRLDSLLSTYTQQGFSGTVLAVQRGQIVLLKGYGFADKERRIPNSPATRYEGVRLYWTPVISTD